MRNGSPVEFLGWRSDDEIRDLYRGAAAVLLPGTEDFGIVPVEAQACGTPVVAFAEGGARETVIDGVTGALVTDRSAAAFADALAGVVARGVGRRGRPGQRGAILDRRLQNPFPERRGRSQRPGATRMMRRYNRLLVAFYVLSDALLAVTAFLAAYWLRFYSGLPVPKGIPPFFEYLTLLPVIGVIVPAAFHIQGIYRLRRGRSRVDDFFAVFVGTVLAVVLGVGGTLYFRTYWLPDELKDAGAYEIAQGVWGLFVLVNVALTYLSREIVREALERRWKAGIGLKRVLIAGAGDLGRMVADKVLQHRELGFQVVGFVDDRAAGDHIGYRGLPLLGTLPETDEIIRREKIDHVYVALPLEEHVKMLGLVEATNREGVDVHVVPDLLQFIALRARLENLDGVPIISLNDVPLRGFNSILKRLIDVSISGCCAARLLDPIPADCVADPVQLQGAGLLHAGAHGPRRQGVPRLQVPLDVRGRRG